MNVQVGNNRALPTDNLGFISITKLAPGRYPTTISLTNEHLRVFKTPSKTTQNPVVVEQRITLVTFELDRHAEFTVELVPDGKPGHVFQGATVILRSGGRQDRMVVQGRIVCFGPRRPDLYCVSIELAPGDREAFLTPREARVHHGTTSTRHVVEIDAVNVITPVLGIKEALVPYAPDGDKPACAELRIKLSHSLQGGPKFEGKATILSVGKKGGEVEIYTDRACTMKQAIGKSLPSALANDQRLKLFVRGTQCGEVKLRLKLDESQIPRVKLAKRTRTLSCTVVALELPPAVAVSLPSTGSKNFGAIELTVRCESNSENTAFVYHWKAGKPLELDGDCSSATVRVVACAPGSALVDGGCTQSGSARSEPLWARCRVTFFRVQPSLTSVAVRRGHPTTVELKAAGVPEEGTCSWTLERNECEAIIEGATDGRTVKIRSRLPGLTVAKLQYTAAAGVEPAQSSGTVVFVGASIDKATVGITGRIDLTTLDTDARRRRRHVLLSLDSDPADWKTGQLVLEAKGVPADPGVVGGETPGTYQWIAPPAQIVQLASEQPDDHGTDQAKVLVHAVANDERPIPARPGYVDEHVEVAYTLGEVKGTDQLPVRVYRHGCSRATWKRGYFAGLLHMCVHDRRTQWGELKNALPPPGAETVGVLDPHGHQHGGRCHQCSGLEEETGASPRDIWHWVQAPPALLEEGRRVATVITNFASKKFDKDFQRFNSDKVHGAHLFGRYLWHRFNVGSGERKAKMFGMLRGRSGERVTYLYAISGAGGKNFDDWCPPLDLGGDPDNARLIRGFDGNNARYVKARAPFDTRAVSINWNQLGHCAAPKLLHAAMKKRLTDIEMVEIWIDPDRTGGYDHLQEIGSCAQCRRILGRMLCDRNAG
ncbi:MAG: hypothetical protein AAGF11_12805 [Myxococcota bacterium]